MRYPDLPPSLQALEEELLEVWRREDLFRRTQEATADGQPFVFYEGPPTANGRPGLHHVLSRTIKDLVCRHRSLQGRFVPRKAGWDTHGLPVEIEAERRLGISGKPEIEALGIERFNQECRDSVFTYKEEWQELSERIGYWLDYDDPYVTFEARYIESVWWILSEMARRGLLYRGYKSVPYCPRCGTALSSHEVAQGYEDVEDPSLTFLGRWISPDGSPDPEGRAFLAWTTTPWTVPANAGLAVHPDLEYVDVQVDGARYVVAASRVEALFGDAARIVARWPGSDLVGQRYERPLDLVAAPAEVGADGAEGAAWSVVAEPFVSADDGTGIVHIAPAFGADDHMAGLKYGLPMLRPVDDEGRFTADVPRIGGQWVKDADPVVVEALRERGLLFAADTVMHSYPHCWRCRSPLLYMARDSWFAATSSLKDELLAHNAAVTWAPPEVGTGRFGEWLENNVDWALSRDRYWGTPLPVWICDEDAEHLTWIGSLSELSDRAGGLPDDFDPHRPFIDDVIWSCECGGTMRRAPEVIDVWFDSGAMPFAQWHVPFENQERFEQEFPADFICEGLDQTRGWFYSLLAISTMLGRGSPFRSVVVNGLLLDAQGLKMAKSRGNAVDPWDAIRDHGADGLRWSFMTMSSPWADKRYDPETLEASRRFFDTLFNTYRFFALYAGIEDWEPPMAEGSVGRPEHAHAEGHDDATSVLDRWIRGRLDELVAEVGSGLDEYQITRAYRAVQAFVDEDLSNWYVRRSRARFWGNDDPVDRDAAFRTLWQCLRTVSILVAPVAPFASDWLHRALTGQSVHLTRFPEPAGLADPGLLQGMEHVRALARLGRAAREELRIRVRQPLRRMQAVVPSGEVPSGELLDILLDELNLKKVVFADSSEGWVQVSARPNYRVLGPRFQKRTEAAAAAIRDLPDESLMTYAAGGSVSVRVDGADHALEPGDLDVVEEALGGMATQSAGGYTVALEPELDEALIQEGLARELVNRIQRLRRDAALHVADRIELGIFGDEEATRAAEAHRDFVLGETLATALEIDDRAPDGTFEHVRQVDLDGRSAWIGLRPSRVPGP